ncbi:FAD-dependent oxidoreductase [Sulfitobacter sp. LCG007]
MKHLDTDILVIGAGSAGLSVTAGAVQMGARVVLLEGNLMGGDCLNYGCVPSKALLASASAAHAQRNAAQYGIADAPGLADYARVMEHVAGVIEGIAPIDSQERFEGLGAIVIREYGRFVSPDEVVAGDTTIKARRIVIATGSSPLVPDIPGLGSVPFLTNETLFDLREKPGHLLIVGGGPIGMEMAQAHVRLGCDVTVIASGGVLANDDPEMAQVVRSQLEAEGVRIEEGRAAGVSGEAGKIAVTTDDGRRFSGTHLLIATGRKLNTDRLDLEKAGIRTSGGRIEVDAGLRTSNRRVYAIGDAAGGMKFTHLAGYHGSVIIRSLLFALPARASTAHIPWCTYTDPELAQVGLTEAQAREKFGDRLEVARFDYADNDRAAAERRTTGSIKVMVARGRPVGATIVGHEAGEQISLWALALANRLKMSQVAGMVAPYPTYGEINKRAAGAYFSPRLFDSPLVKRITGLVQRWVP